VARRRYGKSPAISTAGQQERPRDPAGDQSLAQPIEPRAEYGKAPPEAAPEAKPDVSNLKSQLDQMRQWQPPQQDPLDQFISFHFAGASPNERQWLRGNALALHNPALTHEAAKIALGRGVPRESAEFLHAIGALLQQHYAAMQAHPPPAPPPPIPEPAHADISTEHDHEPDEEPPMTHYAAPVSRGDQGHAVEPEPTMGSIRLTPEQRDIAARSGISETEYARQLIRMQKMKSSGVIK
jgi:hypothetical protein